MFIRVEIKGYKRQYNASNYCADTTGYSQKNWVGVCGSLPETLTLFTCTIKICDIPYSIYDLTENLKPYS